MSIFDQVASALASDFVSGQTVNQQYQPPQRQWVGLTDEEMWNAYTGGSDIINLDYAKAIEAKLKEKNT